MRPEPVAFRNQSHPPFSSTPHGREYSIGFRVPDIATRYTETLWEESCTAVHDSSLIGDGGTVTIAAFSSVAAHAARKRSEKKAILIFYSPLLLFFALASTRGATPTHPESLAIRA